MKKKQVFKQDAEGDIVSDLEQSCFGTILKLVGLGATAVLLILLIILR